MRQAWTRAGGDGASVIAATHSRWDGYQMYNERDVFGTAKPSAFYATSVCGVHGVRLENGRGVVVKVRR